MYYSGGADKEPAMAVIAQSVHEAIAPIADGMTLLVPHGGCGVAMEATRALVRRGARRLGLIALPTSGLQSDLLIGAGCVDRIETSAVSLGESGRAPQFTKAVVAGAIRLKDATCPALYAAAQAAEKGVPFMPLRGLIGSDLTRHRTDWRVIDNPFATNDPIVLLPAVEADVALFHAPVADRFGNVWIGRQRDLILMAHAAKRSVVTVERIHDGNLLEDAALAPGTLAGLYIETIAVAERGAWPLALPGHYPADDAHIADYARFAATADGFASYLDRYVHERRAA
jgi:glutaconate CoA-transferase subunit A